MKSSFIILIVLLIFLCNPLTTSGDISWDDSIKEDKTFHWHASKAELRNELGAERYKYGIGGICVTGGDIEVNIQEVYTDGFDFFTGNILFDDVTVEGDMIVNIPKYGEDDTDNSEYHLFILPISAGGDPFFPQFFEFTEFLEDITNTKFVDTDISDNVATYEGIFNGTHKVLFEWNTRTGLLEGKTVTSPQGRQLVVKQGRGSVFSFLDIGSFTVFLGIVVLIVPLRKRSVSRE